MADSLIGFLNQQIQKTTQAQEQQQKSTSTTTNVTNPSRLNPSISHSNTGSNESNIYQSSTSSQQVNLEASKNSNSQQFSTQGRISSLGGLGITNALSDTFNNVVSGASYLSSGNVPSIGGASTYSASIRNTGESMPIQNPQTAISSLSSQTNTQSHKPLNMSSSGMVLLKQKNFLFLSNPLNFQLL